jgi:hypothetical protein
LFHQKKIDISCASEATSNETETTSKFLREINLVPTIPNNVFKRKESEIILTSPEHKVKRRFVAEKKLEVPGPSGIKSNKPLRCNKRSKQNTKAKKIPKS